MHRKHGDVMIKPSSLKVARMFVIVVSHLYCLLPSSILRNIWIEGNLTCCNNFAGSVQWKVLLTAVVKKRERTSFLYCPHCDSSEIYLGLSLLWICAVYFAAILTLFCVLWMAAFLFLASFSCLIWESGHDPIDRLSPSISACFLSISSLCILGWRNFIHT